MNLRPRARYQAGVNLIELMVSLALGGFLVLGVVNVFLSTKESSQIESALARVQESGRFALDVMSDDLRAAHYTGCNSVKAGVDMIVNDIDYVGLRGYSRSDGAWSAPLEVNDPALKNLNSAAVRDGTDLLNMQVATSLGSNLLSSDIAPSDTSMQLDDNPGCALGNGDVVIVSNCLTAHAVEVNTVPAVCDPSTVTPTQLNFTANNSGGNIEPGYLYEAKTELMRFEAVAWYVGDTGRDRNGMDVYALYRKSMDDPAIEMIEGVEFLQVQYGLRAGSISTPTTRFLSATAVEAGDDWDEVISVRIALLVQSYELVRDADDTRSYVMVDPGAPIGPAEYGGGRVLRQVFRTTTVLRNTDFDT
jgi:type IV pilus assembly protein PilW